MFAFETKDLKHKLYWKTKEKILKNLKLKIKKHPLKNKRLKKQTYSYKQTLEHLRYLLYITKNL